MALYCIVRLLCGVVGFAGDEALRREFQTLEGRP